ncbi:hypothetical protein P154DRAFT_532039 [Amniculicola lignicola CBS 123094]|uniref:Carbonic anhydrase n=1 Tax=Amniculicola lignicola CBS 123094 TaxID=1392246 RepID=A0A6A5WX42_9PLEO|nr:hypothetical protein P154DRAFT_532039 [Amniculicola lignicola CBS 123094]
MSAGALVIISCSDPDPRVDPSRYFNLSANTTSVLRTAGGRTHNAINSLYSLDQNARIGMIVVVQHTGCTSSTGDLESNIRSDITALKSSPYLRTEIPIIGYILDIPTGQLRECSDKWPG